MMKNKYKKILDTIFKNPISGNLKWKDIESLLKYLGAEVSEGSGSRVHIILNEKLATFHRPHPSPDTDKGAIKSVRIFLINAGVTKC